MKAEEILRELEKPDRSRMVRILKSFLLSPEELGEPTPEMKALLEKNKTQLRLTRMHADSIEVSDPLNT